MRSANLTEVIVIAIASIVIAATISFFINKHQTNDIITKLKTK